MKQVQDLYGRAYKLRKDCLDMITHAGSGHLSSCLSAADIMSTLFFDTLNHKQDQFILSKGHAAPLLYAVYAQLGLIPAQDLLNLRKFNSPLEGHPTPRFSYVNVATGSLGQGLSIAIGKALAARMNKSLARFYVLLGDSECSEGQVWEAIELAAHYKLNNIVGIIDANQLGQSNNSLIDMHEKKYQKIFTAHGWFTQIIDGHDITQIIHALKQAKKHKKSPSMIIARTHKGFGIPSIQDRLEWHGKAPLQSELEKFQRELAKTHKKYVSIQLKTVSPPHKLAQRTKKIPLKNFTLPTPIIVLKKKYSVRKTCGEALATAGTFIKNLVVLDADVKNSTYTDIFERKYPKRFIECFIAEQNMMSISMGMSTMGYTPVCATFAAFLTRGYDQIRMAGISRATFGIIGTHVGVSVGQDGPSQMGLEDIALFRTIPNSIILYPCDPISAWRTTELLLNNKKNICYLRATREDTATLYSTTENFKIGGSHILKQSPKDCACIITAGITVHEALTAYTILAHKNIFITIIDTYSIQPIDIRTIRAQAQRFKNHIIVVEDHYAAGGIADAVRTAAPELIVTSLAVRELPRSGTPQELRAHMKIDAQAIMDAVTSSRF